MINNSQGSHEEENSAQHNSAAPKKGATFTKVLLGCVFLTLAYLAVGCASYDEEPKKIFYGRPEGKDDLKLGEKLEITVVGKLTNRQNPNHKNRLIWTVESYFGKRAGTRLNDFGTFKGDDFLGADVIVVGSGVVFRGKAEPVPGFQTVTSITKLTPEEVKAYVDEAARAKEEEMKGIPRKFDPSPNAKPYSGKWGVRMPLPSAKWEDQLNDFKVEEFAAQFRQLTTADWVMINVTHPSGPSHYTGPHPELAKVVGPGHFPNRDLLDEVLDAIKADGKKALVYFACEGFRGKEAWKKHVESQKMYEVEAVRKLILKHYVDTYGDKIDGWWFDGAKVITDKERPKWKATILAGNPKAIVAFNGMAGPPYRSKPECHYFGGHPTFRKKHNFWEPINLPMITDIEKGPWMGTKGAQVEAGYGALGHVFMGLQDRWTGGPCKFPPEQAIDWTLRVLDGGGMYTWAVPRNKSGEISKIREPQFQLLLKINEAVKKHRGAAKK